MGEPQQEWRRHRKRTATPWGDRVEKPISSTPQCRPFSASCVSQSWGCEGALTLWACLLPGNRKAGNYWRFGACGWGCREAVWGASGEQAVCQHSFYPVSPLGSPESYKFWFQGNGHKTEQRRLQLLKNNSQNIKKIYLWHSSIHSVYLFINI